jgi:hypothetical protein
METIELSGRWVAHLAGRVRAWELEGKLDEEDLDRALSTDARAWLDHTLAFDDWAALADVEALVGLMSERLGSEAELVDSIEELVPDLLLDARIEEVVAVGRRLVDGPGFAASQLCERLVRRVDWSYEGGRESFSVRVAGLEPASPALRAMLGATLARLAAMADARDYDVRVDGVDGGSLVVFGEIDRGEDETVRAESRLHRAALVPEFSGNDG